MSTTKHSSLYSSIDDNLQLFVDTGDSFSNLENTSEKEDLYFQSQDSDSHENNIEITKDTHFGKVYNLFFILFI
jgi:hypothetical protein